MDYTATIQYLYNSLPMFQQVGSKAYKSGLENTFALDGYFNHPHRNYRTIHVAGTNGKGSCSHTLAAILQEAGYRVGLYTSPHLVDFRERIRVNGVCISKDYVVDFVGKHRSFFEPMHPSFFELTTALAFLYFADAQVDIAVVEVGLGGRLDCTNIITPDLGIITNISFDHVALLGNTLTAIAREKAGIIKRAIPVVIGETTGETKKIFIEKAEEAGAPVFFAEEDPSLLSADKRAEGGWIYQTKEYPDLISELGGLYQLKNANTVLVAVRQLNRLGYKLDEKAVRSGFAQVSELTGLMGRWQKLREHPALVCDTGHNIGGITYIVEQLQQQQYRSLHIVFGMVNDKDIEAVLSILPKDAIYYFTKASVKRALPEGTLQQMATVHGLKGECYPDVVSAVRTAQKESLPEDFIYVGGSSFIVADLLSNRDALDLD